MKKCQNCGSENSGEMNFCGECGAALPNLPQMVVPLETIQTRLPTERITGSSNSEPEIETVVENRYQPSIPTISTQKPQNFKKILAVFGGLLAIFIMILAGGAAAFYFYRKSQNQTVQIKPTPTATRTPKKETPTPKPSATPEPTPSETPEETPEETPQIIVPPTEKPTQKGSFTINADTPDWQLSDIQTVPSETFRTSVRGKIYLDDVKENVSPEGTKKDKDRRVYREFKTGALLMRTRYADGKVSNVQPVAASDEWQNSPDESGRIEFLINDNSPEYNSGNFVVTVEMVSVPK